MAKNNNYTRKYGYSSLNNVDASGKWPSFHELLGTDVEKFIKSQLEDAVVDLHYEASGDGDNNLTLFGLNTFGEKVCSTKIVNADVRYAIDFLFINLMVGNKSYTGEDSTIRINKSGDLNVNVSFKFLVTGNIAGSTFLEESSQTVTFSWYDDPECTIKDTRLKSIQRTVKPGEIITENINVLFDYAFTNKYLGIEYVENSTTIRHAFGTPLTLKALTLSYGGLYLLRTNTISNLKIEGIEGSESVSDYYYTYYLDNTVRKSAKVTGTNTSNLMLPLLGLSEGVHDLFIRVQDLESDVNSTLLSNDIQITFIYQKEQDSNINATALVTAVPNEIDNCDTSELFRVVTTDRKQGDVKIIVLKSNNLGNIVNINTIEDALTKKDLIFKEINLSLNATDEKQVIEYKSYIEVPSSSSDFIKIITTGNTKSKFYIRRAVNEVTFNEYKEIKINNPKGGTAHLVATLGSILNFSQISNGQVFENLNSKLDESDGFLLETEDNVSLSTFKVSPIEGVFVQPKPLLNSAGSKLSSGPFSIEMVIKTYNCNDLNDELLSIGNIKVCPKHLFVYNPSEDPNSTKPTTFKNATRADFLKNQRLHIMITFDPKYKPTTYNTIYNNLYSEDSITYDNNAEAYPCLKIYVNGTINRTYKLNASNLESGGFNLQIHPSNSNINFYTFRTYDKALSYREVRQNFTSSLLYLSDKETYYKENDILYNDEDFSLEEIGSKQSILNTISLGKCINKFKGDKVYNNRKVLLLVLPEGVKPPYYGNRKNTSKATILVNYPNDKQHSGRLQGGEVKPQGTSAKKYTIHNPSYSDFTFISENEWNNESPTGVEYYKMPGDDIEVTKLVGKVNYASSMQSHKLGATKLFHDGYIHICDNSNPKIDYNWMNGGRKAVLEDDFLYFYTNVPEEDLDKITWDYFKQEDGYYNFEKCYFLGFQTWGSAKGDEATSGYDENTPYYIMLEGADNANPSANFKAPWAAMQCWEDSENVDSNFSQFSGKTNGNPDYLSHLLINDETIVYDPGFEEENSSDKRADAWDVDFGAKKSNAYVKDNNEVYEFRDKAKVSLNRFAEFYNLIYKYDFSSIVILPIGTKVISTETDFTTANGTVIKNYNKILFTGGCTLDGVSVTPGDIYRVEKGWRLEIANAPHVSKWVPAGLYYNNGKWDSLNIVDICNDYTKAKHAFFALPQYDTLKAGYESSFLYYGKEYNKNLYTGYNLDDFKSLFIVMAEAFKIIVHEYTDVDDVTYHQAFIRLISGTDNRAKNTYFLIVGPIGADDSYEITDDNLRKDFKIHLYLDDLDTIFKTDNNGQLVKPYYLLEPPFNKDLEYLWGDLHSGFFYNLDIVCINEIKEKLRKLLVFATGSTWPENINTNLYKYFLSVLKNLPSIAYNHQSEIYYESAETLWQDEYPTAFYKSLENSSNANWKDYNNNKVANPLSLSHGSCYDAEVEYLKDRVLLLSTYVNDALDLTDTYIQLLGGSHSSADYLYVINTEYTSFILHIYPMINNTSLKKSYSDIMFDPIIDKLYDKNDLVYNMAVPGKSSELNTSFTQGGLTIAARWENTDLYKTIKINSGTDLFTDFLKFTNASTVICQNPDYIIDELYEEIDVSNNLLAIEHLILQGAIVNSVGFDFEKCNRLKTLILGKTTNIEELDYALQIEDVLDSSKTVNIEQGEGCSGFKQVILPNNNKLETVILPNCIESLNIGYYPNIKTFEINEGVKITNLVIDGRNSYELINTVIGKYLFVSPETIVYITNIPNSGLWLSEVNSLKLANISNVYFEGVINIGENNTLTQINFNTKKSLVEKFGDITKGSKIFKFANKDVSVITGAQTATMLYSGPAPINLSANGNTVPIVDGHLKINYSISTIDGNSSDVKIDKNTGYITLSEGYAEGKTYKITTVVYYKNSVGSETSKTINTTLTVGFYVPNVGDFAYSNGTFSLTHDDKLGLVGIVFYVSQIDNSDSYNIKVLSCDSISGYPAGPCKSYINNNYWDGTLLSNYLEFIRDILGNADEYYTDVEENRQNVSSEVITYNNPELGILTSNISLNSRSILEQYITRVNNYLEGLGYADYTLNIDNIEDANTKFTRVYDLLNGLQEITIGQSTYYKSDIGSFTYNLYPAILKTLYFKPSVTLTEKGSEYYDRGKWYVPNDWDVSLLVHYRICSTITSQGNSQNNWNSRNIPDLYFSKDNKFTPDAFSTIQYLLSTDNVHTIHCNSNGCGYSYGEYDNNLVGWYYGGNNYYFNSGARDLAYLIFPCCNFVLTK